MLSRGFLLLALLLVLWPTNTRALEFEMQDTTKCESSRSSGRLMELGGLQCIGEGV